MDVIAYFQYIDINEVRVPRLFGQIPDAHAFFPTSTVFANLLKLP
jgi:hypothetical protein